LRSSEEWKKLFGQGGVKIGLIISDKPYGLLASGDGISKDTPIPPHQILASVGPWYDALDERGAVLLRMLPHQFADWRNAMEGCGFTVSKRYILCLYELSAHQFDRTGSSGEPQLTGNQYLLAFKVHTHTITSLPKFGTCVRYFCDWCWRFSFRKNM
jgi:hypothetical protein